MSTNNYTTKRRKFKHLTGEKRAQLELLLRQGITKTEIAKVVGISRSTLYNELSRGTVEQLDSELRPYRCYFWDAGQRVYEEHRRNSRPCLKFAKAFDFLTYAEEQMLRHKLSPDAVCGRARREGRFQQIVCTKTLYNYIDQRLIRSKTSIYRLKSSEKSSVTGNGRQNANMG